MDFSKILLTIVKSTVIMFQIVVQCVNFAKICPFLVDITHYIRLCDTLQPLAQFALGYKSIQIFVYFDRYDAFEKQYMIKIFLVLFIYSFQIIWVYNYMTLKMLFFSIKLNFLFILYYPRRSLLSSGLRVLNFSASSLPKNAS